jgi:hypothetical protein
MVRALFQVIVVAAGLMVAQATGAQTAPPAGATGQCKDGTYSMSASKTGACRGHQGVKDWYASATPKTSATPPPSSSPAAPSTTSSTAAKSTASPAAKAAARPQAVGGGPGLVWVNTSSNVYHCYGTDFYGKTKQGAYMSEADAKAKGAHPERGKPCTK